MNPNESYPYFGPLIDAEARKAEILSILSSGKAVRFTMDSIWKDIDTFEPDDMGDLRAFRKSGTSNSDFICWNAGFYSITAVEK